MARNHGAGVQRLRLCFKAPRPRCECASTYMGSDCRLTHYMCTHTWHAWTFTVTCETSSSQVLAVRATSPAVMNMPSACYWPPLAAAVPQLASGSTQSHLAAGIETLQPPRQMCLHHMPVPPQRRPCESYALAPQGSSHSLHEETRMQVQICRCSGGLQPRVPAQAGSDTHPQPPNAAPPLLRQQTHFQSYSAVRPSLQKCSRCILPDTVSTSRTLPPAARACMTRACAPPHTTNKATASAATGCRTPLHRPAGDVLQGRGRGGGWRRRRRTAKHRRSGTTPAGGPCARGRRARRRGRSRCRGGA